MIDFRWHNLAIIWLILHDRVQRPCIEPVNAQPFLKKHWIVVSPNSHVFITQIWTSLVKLSAAAGAACVQAEFNSAALIMKNIISSSARCKRKPAVLVEH